MSASTPPHHPFLLVNAASGGGKVQAAVVAAAQTLGLEHHVATPGDDFDAILTAAVQGGCDLLCAAGGDGTLSTVADAAMAAGLPMLAVPAGTRNHFALDVGLDLEDPAGVLRGALEKGFDRPVDVGSINGATFLNNVSIGVYAQAVEDPDYRAHKVRVLAHVASEALTTDESQSADLTVASPGPAQVDTEPGTAAVLLSNNAYSPTFAPGARLRPRLDAGEVWVYVGGGLNNADSLLGNVASLLSAQLHKSVLRAAFATTSTTISASRPDVPVAVDGEHRGDIQAPFTVASRAGALTLRVPDDPAPLPLHVTLRW